MRSQRTFFFGTKPEATPKKDGENPLVPERRSRPSSPESFEIRFTNETVTQFGGYPLWNQFCNDIGLNQHFARHIRMNRGPLGFTAPELARFLTDAKILGAERLMHVETMRLDPLLCRSAALPESPYFPVGRLSGFSSKSMRNSICVASTISC